MHTKPSREFSNACSKMDETAFARSRFVDEEVLRRMGSIDGVKEAEIVVADVEEIREDAATETKQSWGREVKLLHSMNT